MKNNRTGAVEKTVERRLCENDLPAVLDLQSTVAHALTDPSLFIQNTREEFLNILAHGELYGLFAGNRLIAAICFYFPGDTAENHGRDLGLSGDALLTCAVLDSCFVAPDYRGNGIARDLAERCIHRAVCACGARNIAATVSPKNAASLLSLVPINGMRICALRQKYGCKLRYILRYEHQSPKTYTVYEKYLLSDVYGISRALADGYEGVTIFRDGETIFLWVAK